MKIKRLKLFNDIIQFAIERKKKRILKRIAYKNKMTMSEYIRNLIDIDILRHERENAKCDLACNAELTALKTMRRSIHD